VNDIRFYCVVMSDVLLWQN